MALKLNFVSLGPVGAISLDSAYRPRLTSWLVVGSLVLVGCGRAPTTSAPPAPSPPTPAAPTATPPVAAPVTPSPPTAPAAPAPTEPQAAPQVAPPPSAPAAPRARLPEALIKQWEPMSNVLLAFGPLTLTPEAIQWGEGQRSPYTLISQEGGFVLQLETSPKFYDTPYPYIKLIPKSESGTMTGVDVAFYENAAQLQGNQYTMYGSYFLK